MSPSSRGPAPHFHTTFSETFIVEEGEVAYFDGRAWRTLRPGDTMHAAAGDVHALRKEGAEPATLLMALSPGVPREEYFAQLATVNERDLSRLHTAHDNHFVDDYERWGHRQRHVVPPPEPPHYLECGRRTAPARDRHRRAESGGRLRPQAPSRCW
ncbi:cupin domain-containing protein [Kitasatospora sp. NPDC001159]